MNVDDCRAAFAAAFEKYAQEGARMKDLLLSLDPSSERRDFQSINAQQLRLNEARRLYEEARTRYVQNVLRDYVKPGEAV